MARVHYVKAAAKDYPRAGIAKGESYYWWKNFRQVKQMSKHKPPHSQTASSEYARSVWSLLEGLEAWEGDWAESDKDDLVGALEEIRDNEQDKFDNMPEGLQQGDTGQTIEQNVESLDEWISELQSIEFPEEGEEVKEGDETPLEKALASAINV